MYKNARARNGQRAHSHGRIWSGNLENDPKQRRRWQKRYRKHLASPKWKKLAAQVRRRDVHRCRGCGLRRKLEVHHIHYRTLGHESGAELVSLCESCHRMEHQLGLARRESHWTGKCERVRKVNRKARRNSALSIGERDRRPFTATVIVRHRGQERRIEDSP